MDQNRNPRWRPSTILYFWKPDFWAIWSPWSAEFPPRYQIWRKNVDRRRNYGSKSKSKMAAVPAVRHLGFVTSSFRTTHEVFSLGHIGLWNFMLIRCIVLKIWRYFADLAWNAYSRVQNFGFWGVGTSKRDWSSSRPPKGTSLAETALTCQFWCRSVYCCDLCVRRRNKKKERNETFSGAV